MDDGIPQAEQGESISALLEELNHGNRGAESRLMGMVYPELRKLAAVYMARERPNHTLQPTALVNEAYLRLIDRPDISWKNRSHFFAVAAQAMRHILVDKARARRAGKRGGPRQQVTLDDVAAIAEAPSIDLLALDEALTRLAALDPRQSRLVELRFFGGLSLEEAAQIVGVSDRTAKRDWKMARAWLRGELMSSAGGPDSGHKSEPP
jgi:RNA polymerase sigma factor (TIGR02999 family)